MKVYEHGVIDFAWVDVFASKPLSGNPLPIVPDANGLDETVMMAIAREFNQSETTFVCRPTVQGATIRLRSFTPSGVEVTGAGHNALGAWWWLAAQDRVAMGVGSLAQQLGHEVWPVRLIGEGRLEGVAMAQGEPVFGPELADTATLSAALGVADEVQMARVVSTGAAHLLVELADRGAVDRVEPDAASLRAVLVDVGGQGCYVWAADPEDPIDDAYARFFNPTVGIVEDPATGSAAGPLAALLTRRRGDHAPSEIRIKQGAATGRSSRLEVHVDGERLELVGVCTVVGEGQLAIPMR